MATRYGLTGTVAATTAAIVAVLVALSPSERAQSLGLTQHGALITAQDAGAADAVATVAVSPGTAGQVLTVSDAGLPHWAAAQSSGPTVYYAESFTAVAGSESASISGTGATATIALSASSTSRTYGSGGVTAPRAILTLPAGTREVWVETQVVSVTGSGTSGFRYLTMAVQNVSSGVPTAVWGVTVNDNASAFAGNLLGGANTGSPIGTASIAADRWVRATLALTETRLAVQVGTGSAGARPSLWGPVTSPALPVATAYNVIPDTAGQLYLVVVYQGFGTGGANTITVRVTVRATT